MCSSQALHANPAGKVLSAWWVLLTMIIINGGMKKYFDTQVTHLGASLYPLLDFVVK